MAFVDINECMTFVKAPLILDVYRIFGATRAVIKIMSVEEEETKTHLHILNQHAQNTKIFRVKVTCIQENKLFKTKLSGAGAYRSWQGARGTQRWKTIHPHIYT